MNPNAYTYIIVGGGLAGASAAAGIREIDPQRSILLIGNENHLPYNRPPLTKKLWTGEKKVEDIFIYDPAFYERAGITVVLGLVVTAVDAAQKTVLCGEGKQFRYEKLLLATGAVPNRLRISGATLDGVCYYRFLDDYLTIKDQAVKGKSALVIGGGFIGSEIAAALAMNNESVTMLFPEAYICHRTLPDPVGRSVQGAYQKHGVRVLSHDSPSSIAKNNGGFITVTEKGKTIKSDLVIAGVGVTPEMNCAKSAGVTVADGIAVNEFLETSNADIYAAGDNALFNHAAFDKPARVEHWDNAMNQGKLAGRNMAGAHEPYTYMPYFFSDLFDFGYEAVGEVDPKLDTFCDWQEENRKGVIYYLRDKKVRGVMMCNVWDKVSAARALLLKGEPMSTADLESAIV
jgi:3-phenylpropionate/trans-cinnamate dioxygenase ferredoxin reductase component